MIGQLTGKPTPHTKDSLIIDVRGVGYKVFISSDLHLYLLKQDQVTLFIHTHIRDDTLDLYGFKTLEDLKLFQFIINIPGVGPKIALALIDKGTQNITLAVAKADVDFFTSIPRLGKKNAQKIIIELKPKLGDLEDLDLVGDSSQDSELINALISLGFTKKQASEALKQSANSTDTLEEKIIKAIKFLGQQ